MMGRCKVKRRTGSVKIKLIPHEFSLVIWSIQDSIQSIKDKIAKYERYYRESGYSDMGIIAIYTEQLHEREMFLQNLENC